MEGKVSFDVRSSLRPLENWKLFCMPIEQQQIARRRWRRINTEFLSVCITFQFYDWNLPSRSSEKKVCHVELSVIDKTLFTCDSILFASEFPFLTRKHQTKTMICHWDSVLWHWAVKSSTRVPIGKIPKTLHSRFKITCHAMHREYFPLVS